MSGDLHREPLAGADVDTADDARPGIDDAESPGEPTSSQQPHHASTGTARRSRVGLVTTALALAIPGAMQLKNGVDDVGLVEEWGIQWRFDLVGPVFWAPSDAGGLAGQSIRPLTVAPHAAAYVLDPDSFVWYHLLHAGALVLQVAAMLLLCRRLRLSRVATVTGALLFALFPAWDGLFTFRAVHMHVALALFVYAAAEMVEFHRRPRWRSAVACIAATSTSLMFYEVAYIGMVAVPLLVLMDGRVTWRRFLRTTTVWFVGPFLNGLRVLAVWTTNDSLYQREITAHGDRQPIREFADLARLVLGQGADGFIQPPFGTTFGIVAVTLTAVAVVSIAGAAVDDRLDVEDRPRPSQRAVAAMTVGSIVMAPVAALIYWPQPVLMIDRLRVFSIGSAFLALAIAGVVHMIADVRSPLTRPLAAGVAVTMTVVAVVGGAAQRDHWSELSDYQENLLGAVIGAIPPDAADSPVIVVLDPERMIGPDVYRFAPAIFNLAMDYLVPGSQTTIVCQVAVPVPADQLAAAPLLPGGCVSDGNLLRSEVGTVSVNGATLVEIAAAVPGRTAGWTDGRVELRTDRQRTIVDCVGAGTCDEGELGVQARLVSPEALLSLPSPP